MDIEVPVMNGYEATTIIRNELKQYYNYCYDDSCNGRRKRKVFEFRDERLYFKTSKCKSAL